MPLLALFVSGLLFGAGLTVSGMVNPMKVLNFLDFAGAWDASLLFVMAGGLAVTFIGYRLIGRRGRPLFAPAFAEAQSKGIDGRLVAGAAIFGLGWGLTGFCPGPAIAGLVFGRAEIFVFILAMAAGTLAARALLTRSASSP